MFVSMVPLTDRSSRTRKPDGWSGKVAFISTYPPVEGSLALHTEKLTGAIQKLSPHTDCMAVTMTRHGGKQHSPEQIHYQISKDTPESYREAARFLNCGKVGLVCLQHSHEIFGGPGGGYILALLRDLQLPIVTTLHSVTKNPAHVQRSVLGEVCQHSERLVVSTARMARRVRATYNAAPGKLDTITIKDSGDDAATESTTTSSNDWSWVAAQYLRCFGRAVEQYARRVQI